MVFNDTTSLDGLIQDCEYLVFGRYGTITNDTEKLREFTRLLNRAYDQTATLVMESDGYWEWDDVNHGNRPVATTNIVSGQSGYQLDLDHLVIHKVLVADESGNFSVIRPLGVQDQESRWYLEDNGQTGGVPSHYDKIGNELILFPQPNYNETGGLKVYYQRQPSYFTNTDTTKTPGVPYLFHRYLSLCAALDYAVVKRLDVAKDISVLKNDMKESLIAFFSNRDADRVKLLKPIRRSSR